MSRNASGAGGNAANRRLIDASMSETQWAYQVERLFQMAGWTYYHPYDARRANTILDYVAWRERVIWVELKKQNGRLTRDRWVEDGRGHRHFVPGQFETVASLKHANQEVYVWRPADYEEVCRVLGVEVAA